MPHLTRHATAADIQAAWDDNCAYDATGSVTQAQTLVQAGRMMVARASRAQKGDEFYQLDINAIERQVGAAIGYIEANDTTSDDQGTGPGGVRYFDARNFRD